MDLMQLQTQAPAEEGAILEILHPVTFAPLGVKLVLLGADSETYRSAQNKLVNARVQNRGARARLTAEDIEAQALNLLVAATKGWEGVEWDGAPLAFSSDNVRMVYTALPWLRDQAQDFIMDRANFLFK